MLTRTLGQRASVVRRRVAPVVRRAASRASAAALPTPTSSRLCALHSAAMQRTRTDAEPAPVLAPSFPEPLSPAEQPPAAGVALASHPATYDPAKLTGVLKDLHERGMLAALTHPQEMIAHLASPTSVDAPLRSIYAGFDPTAPSLHIGNLLVLMVLRRLQKAGHRPICVVGGATGMIGDPSGRSTERQMMGDEQLRRNIEGITRDIRKFLVFDTPTAGASSPPASSSPSLAPALLMNNASWFSSLSLIPFLSSIGQHFRLGPMLAKDSVASRLAGEGGMSFTEFTYQVLQGYDFLHLYKAHQCTVQVGGTDQWGNITAGVELIKREAAAAARTHAKKKPPAEPQVFGLTLPLLTTADGKKFGKSMGNAPIWLSAPSDLAPTAEKELRETTSSPYQLYQYFLSTADADLIRYFKLFTDASLEEIQSLEQDYLVGPERRPQHLAKLLAESVTLIVHGASGLAAAQQSSSALFGSGSSVGGASAFEGVALSDFLSRLTGVTQLQLTRDDLIGRSLVDLAVLLQLTKTKAEARRLIAAGGLYLNNQRVEEETRALHEEDLVVDGRACLVRSGKKKQAVAIMKE